MTISRLKLWAGIIVVSLALSIVSVMKNETKQISYLTIGEKT